MQFDARPNPAVEWKEVDHGAVMKVSREYRSKDVRQAKISKRNAYGYIHRPKTLNQK
jgi:hypothetical protein